MISHVRPSRQVLLRCLYGAAGVLLVLAGLELVLGLGLGFDHAGSYCGIAVVFLSSLACALRGLWAPHLRHAWLVAAFALFAWALGFAIDADSTGSTFGVAAVLYGVGYVGLGAGLIVALVSSGRMVHRHSFWVDCCDVVLLLAALGAATLIPLAEGWPAHDSSTAVPALAYPLADAVLLTMLGVTVAATGRRPGRESLVQAASLLLLIAVDICYLLLAREGGGEPGWVEFLWYLAVAGIGWSAWRAPSPRLRDGIRPSTAALGIAICAGTIAASVLVVDGFVELPAVATVLAALALAGSALRMTMAFAEVRGLADERRVAMTDALTELPNQDGFARRLQAALDAGDGPLALLLIDLDDFKGVVSALGYGAAEEIVASVGRNLRLAGRAGDQAGRLGRSQFALALDGCDREGAFAAATRLANRIGTATEVGGLVFRIHASIGIAVAGAGTGSGDAELLLRQADRALYDSRDRPGSISIFDGDLETAGTSLALAAELKRALEAREIELFLQPQAEIASGRVLAAEALARWRHPRLGLLTPDRFLPILARTDLADEFSEYVLSEAIALTRQLCDEGHPLAISVNLTPADVVDGDLPDRLGRMLTGAGADPELFVVEITEEGALVDFEAARHTLDAVRHLGVRVALDDFGTGNSTLSHVRELPVDALKLDRSFVADLTSDPTCAAIVGGVVGIAQALGLRVVAEGIETDDQWNELARLGCDTAQGWILSAPLPRAEFVASLDSVATRAHRLAAGRETPARPDRVRH